MLFLDDVDVFTIVRQRIKYNKLVNEKELVYEKYTKTKTVLDQLNSIEAIEKFAREEKMFKRDDEDIFIIVE
jgi:long-subunit acyl-CoA synthetase (AMP-forming)